MVSSMTIIVDRSGLPVELDSPADWRRAIMRGHIRRTTLVTLIGRGPPQLVAAEQVAELATILDEVEPQDPQEQPPERSTAPGSPAAALTSVTRPKNVKRSPTPRATVTPSESLDVQEHVDFLSVTPEPEAAPAGSRNSTVAWIGGSVALILIVASIRSCNFLPEAPIAADPVQNTMTSAAAGAPIAARDTFETSFDCDVALAEAEDLICRNSALARQDRELAALYDRLLSETAEEDKWLLRREQRAWLELRNACVDELHTEACLERAYSDRTSALEIRQAASAELVAEEDPVLSDESTAAPGEIDDLAPRLDQAAPARASGSLAGLVSVDDYPSAALLAEEQGTTGFELKIGVDGRVTECVVTSSSGSSALDAATCRIMSSRARFTPARDSSGNPVSDSVQSRITWRLGE